MGSAGGGATMKRILQVLESIVFAGMKPDAQTAPPRQFKWLGPLRGPLERLLSGSAPTDPLYLTNRTMGQKLKSWSLIGIPCLALLVGIGFLLSNLLNPPEAKPAKELTAAEITAKLLPNTDKDLKIGPAPDVQVLEAKLDGNRLIGRVKNTSTREIAVAELMFELTDTDGSQCGAISAIVKKIPPSGTKDFAVTVRQHNAATALVREVTSR